MINDHRTFELPSLPPRFSSFASGCRLLKFWPLLLRRYVMRLSCGGIWAASSVPPKDLTPITVIVSRVKVPIISYTWRTFSPMQVTRVHRYLTLPLYLNTAAKTFSSLFSSSSSSSRHSVVELSCWPCRKDKGELWPGPWLYSSGSDSGSVISLCRYDFSEHCSSLGLNAAATV